MVNNYAWCSVIDCQEQGKYLVKQRDPKTDLHFEFSLCEDHYEFWRLYGEESKTGT